MQEIYKINVEQIQNINMQKIYLMMNFEFDKLFLMLLKKVFNLFIFKKSI